MFINALKSLFLAAFLEVPGTVWDPILSRYHHLPLTIWKAHSYSSVWRWCPFRGPRLLTTYKPCLETLYCPKHVCYGQPSKMQTPVMYHGTNYSNNFNLFHHIYYFCFQLMRPVFINILCNFISHSSKNHSLRTRQSVWHGIFGQKEQGTC